MIWNLEAPSSLQQSSLMKAAADPERQIIFCPGVLKVG
jgi:hypothetical protein